MNATHARPVHVASRDAKGTPEIALGAFHRIVARDPALGLAILRGLREWVTAWVVSDSWATARHFQPVECREGHPARCPWAGGCCYLGAIPRQHTTLCRWPGTSSSPALRRPRGIGKMPKEGKGARGTPRQTPPAPANQETNPRLTPTRTRTQPQGPKPTHRTHQPHPKP